MGKKYLGVFRNKDGHVGLVEIKNAKDINGAMKETIKTIFCGEDEKRDTITAISDGYGEKFKFEDFVSNISVMEVGSVVNADVKRLTENFNKKKAKK
jgi:hypothetical protein